MSVSAYMFIKTRLGKISDVIVQLREVPEIISASVVTGEFDIVVKIVADSLETLYDITSEKIHMVTGIMRIETAIIERELMNE